MLGLSEASGRIGTVQTESLSRDSQEYRDFLTDLKTAWEVLPNRDRREFVQDVQMASGVSKDCIIWAWSQTDLNSAALAGIVQERWRDVPTETRRAMLLRLMSEQDRSRDRKRKSAK
ncbi:hypothetical protein [Aureliella helgolandensis]|uniref:Uncharacterized protein n=1 Tax=Aureliella helgolandensis TaxID=2527968 RepID=A0A518G4F6_9BACT|nr:hypothetical protein [Aureliella helgolandensis]QDV23462.1 hypothetical protein Q31a_17600 [Aureliella helgolandensis]